MTDYLPQGASPTDLPAWTGNLSTPNGTAQHNGNHSHNGNGAARHNGADHDGGRHNGHAPVADYAAVQELRNRVSTRLTSEGGSSYEALDAEARRLRTRTLIMEELQTWVLHRTTVGLPAPSMDAEDALIDAVTAALAGLGRLEPLLLRDDVEDIFFNGTAPTMLRLSDGSKVQGPPIAASNDELKAMIQQLGTTLGDGISREFSDARPLMALRLKAVGDLLGARLSAATDVTPYPAGTIRVHRHAEGDLDVAYAKRMIDAPLRELLRASVLAGVKICFVGEMGAGKTFLLRCACAEIPLDRMIVTVEDERELGLHVLPLRDEHGKIVRNPDGSVVPRRPPALVRAYEARPANSEGVGRIDQADLLFHALRDSADVLVLGESRGGDIVHLLDAATNGTSGVMCTLHANSAGAVFDRIVQLVLKAQPPLPTEWALRASTALDLIVHVRRNREHERFVSEVIEVKSGQLGERGMPVVNHLFEPRDDGRAVPTGHKPSDELAAKLVDVGFSMDWLDRDKAYLSDWDRPSGGESL
jgi:pilus assembly protein CpaF